MFLVNGEPANYRLEYWKRALAPFCPYFFRSFTLESLVNNPLFLSGSRSEGLYKERAFFVQSEITNSDQYTEMYNLKIVLIQFGGEGANMSDLQVTNYCI